MPRMKKFKGYDGHPTKGELKICHSRVITYEQYKKEQKKQPMLKMAKFKPYDMNNTFPKIVNAQKSAQGLIKTVKPKSIVLTEENIKKEVKKIKKQSFIQDSVAEAYEKGLLTNITKEFLDKYAPKQKKEPLKRNIIL
jgi:hypothetical protein